MLITLALLPLAAAIPSSARQSSGNEAYDYVIVGGGTSGLVVANRLSEDPSVSVLVIEAGDSALNNTAVSNPNGYGEAFGTAIDWAYETVTQTYGGGIPQTMRAGKVIGGTSTINGLAYTRAESAQIDNWEKLGNEGWNWDALFPYYKKSEHFQVPATTREVAGHLTYEPEAHGGEGPQLTGWTYTATNGSLPGTLNSTYQNLGLSWNPDVNSGSMVGSSVFPRLVDQELDVRADAARAYYYPYQNRINLKLLVNTQANKIVWKNGSETATAYGVEITSADGTTSVVEASKEVILSAGALVSPLLLELSGVGNPSILSQHDIQTVVNLPTVGENLQDQMNNALEHSAPGNFTLSDGLTYVAYPSVDELFLHNTSQILTIAAQVKASLPAYAAQVASINGNVTKASDLLDFFTMQYDLVFEAKAPLAEVLVAFYSTASPSYWDSEYWTLLPFSRGNVHIASPSWNGNLTGRINPNYFMLEWDLQEQAQAARFIRELYSTAPFSSIVESELTPGTATVAKDASDEQWAPWLKSNYRSNFHPVGTAAMMPKEKGGVVDAELKVYGTSNVRVIDASILPFQVCGHLVSTLYAVAERASDLIKESA